MYRHETRLHLSLRALLALFVLLSMLTAAGAPVAAAKADLAMGNPSHATTTNTDDYLLDKPYYALSYDNSTGTPNWVSWRLTKTDIGGAGRGDFYADTALPSECDQVKPAEYSGTGFDTGHMCPCADRSANKTMSTATFAMSNMVPQSPRLNEQTWKHLEDYCRSLAKQGEVLYIVDGPWGQGGEGKKGKADTIGGTPAVTVPAECWKVILALPHGVGDDPKKVDSSARLIAVIMPNTMEVSTDWSAYRVSVAQVEKLTGYTFFDRVPASVIEPLKQKVDAEPVKAASHKTQSAKTKHKSSSGKRPK